LKRSQFLTALVHDLQASLLAAPWLVAKG